MPQEDDKGSTLSAAANAGIAVCMNLLSIFFFSTKYNGDRKKAFSIVGSTTMLSFYASTNMAHWAKIRFSFVSVYLLLKGGIYLKKVFATLNSYEKLFNLEFAKWKAAVLLAHCAHMAN